MSRSPRTLLHRTPLALSAVAALLGATYACGSSTTTAQAEPPVGPQGTQVGSGSTGEVQRRPREPLQSLLQGRTSGVIVTQAANGAIAVRISGAESFYSGTAPLYIVDGTPFTPGPGGTLTGINPEDIESIEVLKGPPETTIYGVRGANGVVLVKTKRPMKAGGGS